MRHDATAPIVNDVIPDGERPTWRSFADMVEGGRYDGEIEETTAARKRIN